MAADSVRGTVVVTGTSTGIGRATAAHLDRLGFTVYATVREQSDAQALCHDRFAREGTAPEVPARAVAHALTARRPRNTSFVGPDA